MVKGQKREREREARAGKGVGDKGRGAVGPFYVKYVLLRTFLGREAGRYLPINCTSFTFGGPR